MFSSRSFMCFGLIFKPFNPFWVYFCIWYEKMCSFPSFTRSCPVFPAPLIEETVFPLLCVLALFAVGWLAVSVWVYFRAVCSVVLICASVSLPVPDSVDYCSFAYSQKSRSVIPPALFFFLRLFWLFRFLCVRTNFQMICSSQSRKPWVIETGWWKWASLPCFPDLRGMAFSFSSLSIC